MDFMAAQVPDKKAKLEIWCKHSTRKKFNVICAQLDVTMGECLDQLCDAYEERNERYNVAGLRR